MAKSPYQSLAWIVAKTDDPRASANVHSIVGEGFVGKLLSQESEF